MRHSRTILLIAMGLIAGRAAGGDGRPAGFQVWADRAEPPAVVANWTYHHRYQVDRQVKRAGGQSLLCSATGGAETGACQDLMLDLKHAEELTFSAWARAEDVTKASQHLLAAEGTYADGSPFPRQEFAFPSETHDWQKGEVRLRVEKPLKELTLYLLSRASKGKVWFDDAALLDQAGRSKRLDAKTRIENLLANGGFEEESVLVRVENGLSAPPWSGSWYGYYSVDSQVAREGRHSLRVDLSYPGNAAQIVQKLKVEGEKPDAVVFSGWCKATRLRGAATFRLTAYLFPPGGGWKDAIPVGLTFKTGTHDWEYSETKLPLPKTVNRGEIQVSLANCMGTVWLDDIKLVGVKEDKGQPSVIRDYVENGSAEKTSRYTPLREWMPPSPALPPPGRADERRGYLLSSQNYLSLSHPLVNPEAEDVTDTLRLFASPGEYEPVTLSLTALKHAEAVGLAASDLKGPAGAVISREHVDIRAVVYRPMYQHHTHVALWGGDAWHEWRPHFLERRAETTVPAGRTQPFWITVHVPQATPPGIYTGTIAVRPQNLPASEAALRVRVLPIALSEPPVVRGMYLLSVRHATKENDLARKALVDMREHGMNTWPPFYTNGFLPQRKAAGQPWDWSEADANLALLRDVGFTGPLIIGPIKREESEWLETIKALRDKCADKTWPPVALYVEDEPCHPDLAEKCIAKMKQIREVWPDAKLFVTHGSLAWQAWCDQYAMEQFVNWPCLQYLDHDNLARARQVGQEMFLYNGGSTGRDALDDRFYWGYHAWRAGVRGVTQFIYAVPGQSPHNTLTIDYLVYGYGSPEGRSDSADAPVAGGLIPTTAWEGVREGVDDYRYLHTLKLLVDRAAKEGKAAEVVAQAERFFEELRRRVELNFMRREERYVSVDPSLFHAWRWQAARLIVRLQEALAGGGARKSDGPRHVRIGSQLGQPLPIAPGLCSVAPDGYITTWLTCGPFPSYEGEEPQDKILDKPAESYGYGHDFLEALGGEAKAAPSEGMALTGEHGQMVAWRAWFSDDRRVNLNHATGVGRGPSTWRARNKVGYAYAVLVSPQPRPVLFKLGCARQVQVWLNGSRIFERAEGSLLRTDKDLDKFEFSSELRAGDNPMLIKLTKGGWEWAFGLRACDPETGRPITDLTVKLPVAGGGAGVLCRTALRAAPLKEAYPTGSRPTLQMRMPRQGHPLVRESLRARARVLDASGKEMLNQDLGDVTPRALLGEGLRCRLNMDRLAEGSYEVCVIFQPQGAQEGCERRFAIWLYESY